MNDVYKEYEPSPAAFNADGSPNWDWLKQPSSDEEDSNNGDIFSNTAIKLAGMMKNAPIQLVAGAGQVLMGDKNIDCVACNLGPGDTESRIPTTSEDQQCFPMATCGETFADTVSQATQTMAQIPSFDQSIPQRLDKSIKYYAPDAFAAVSTTTVDKGEPSRKSRDLLEELEYSFPGSRRLKEMVDGSDGLLGTRRHLNEHGAFPSDVLPTAYTTFKRITVYCSKTDGTSSVGFTGCTDRDLTKRVVRGLMAGVRGQHSISVYPHEIDDYFREYVDDAYVEREYVPPPNGECPGYSVFNVVITAMSKNIISDIQTAFDLVDKNRDKIMSDLEETDATRRGIDICDFVVTDVSNHETPPFERYGTYVAEGNLGPTVTLSRPGEPTPVSMIHPDEQLVLAVHNFPTGVDIYIKAIPSDGDPYLLVSKDDADVVFDDFHEDNSTSSAWTVPSHWNGTYTFKATAPVGFALDAFTPLFQVVPRTTRRRRRLITVS